MTELSHFCGFQKRGVRRFGPVCVAGKWAGWQDGPQRPSGPLGFDFAQHRQTLRPSRRRDPQQSPASFRIAVGFQSL